MAIFTGPILTLPKPSPLTSMVYHTVVCLKDAEEMANSVDHDQTGPGRAKTCLMPYANNKGADQPAHPSSLISAFVVRSLDSIISLVSRSKFSRF